jgi:hypothetical protein
MVWASKLPFVVDILAFFWLGFFLKNWAIFFQSPGHPGHPGPLFTSVASVINILLL